MHLPLATSTSLLSLSLSHSLSHSLSLVILHFCHVKMLEVSFVDQEYGKPKDQLLNDSESNWEYVHHLALLQ